jgi:hypothetical protein
MIPDRDALPENLGRLRENLLDLEVAIADAVATIDAADPRAAAHLADLSTLYRLHVVALARYELREVPR